MADNNSTPAFVVSVEDLAVALELIRAEEDVEAHGLDDDEGQAATVTVSPVF